MPKIALVKFHVVTDYGYRDTEFFATAISEWEEVTYKELKLLKEFYSGRDSYSIIEFVDNQKEKIEFAVKEQLKYAREEEARKEAEKKIKTEKAIARKQKQEQKKLEEKKQLLEKLKKEFGE